MRPRFLADADFNHKIIVGLRRRERLVDVLGAHEGGVIGASDLDVLRIAAEAGRILLSHDRRTMVAHFRAFATRRTCPGLILVEQSLDIGTAIEDLLLIWSATEYEEWTNRVGFIPI